MAKSKTLKKTEASGKYRYPSWKTTDEQELEIRRERARREPMRFKKTGGVHRVFGNYEVWRTDAEPGQAQLYRVELRSFGRLINTCDCPDFEKSALGTCKHVEHLVAHVPGKHSPTESTSVEIFLDYTGEKTTPEPAIHIPAKIRRRARDFIEPFLDAGEKLKRPYVQTLTVLFRRHEEISVRVRQDVRISRAVRKWLERMLRRAESERLAKRYGDELRDGAGSTGFLRLPLYDYQIDGMLHLAFKGRAMLTDEMGLGKTVQAIAAANVLQELYGIRRVLVVSPASLKTEWEEQIDKFTALPAEVLFGGRKERLHVYQATSAFFLLTNYEQILRDWREINERFRPDLVILDEAQRIKNWKTKTARAVKALESRFAFVLTGTPLENRIDELYSLTEFVDPTLFGSLFRFNRRFYNFDAEGKTAGFKNLREMHETVTTVMLRRRKDQIAEQLPERIDNNYFVKMTPEQLKRYEDYQQVVNILVQKAKARPLTPAEHDRLQQCLSCMRMLCDTCYILDQTITASPKVDELIKVLNDLWDSKQDRKVIIFSEWTRMLDLVREQLENNEVAYALHTGSVPQKKRRDEINRFKNDPECRVFLSSDSGSVGLNLQVASVVINLDLPWNPAKLEQRIARCWRKHQRDTVNVINIIAENSIEQRMLGTLNYKQGLADAVLDARGDMEAIAKPDARNKFMERLATVLQDSFAEEVSKLRTPEPGETPPEEKLRQEIAVTLGNRVQFCAGLHDEKDRCPRSILAVSATPEKVRDELVKAASDAFGQSIPPDAVHVIDCDTHALLQSLAAAGLITINTESMEEFYRNDVFESSEADTWSERAAMATPLCEQAERKLKMGRVLFAGGFPAESAEPALEATRTVGRALAVLSLPEVPKAAPAKLLPEHVQIIAALPDFDPGLLDVLQLCLQPDPEITEPEDLLAAGSALLEDLKTRQASPA
ncbi:MAG: DEAD/DEAH box helicase [Lentisphaeria bacterium]|nr:DEAD/DEAH box helicase [Lentisphaeria bacterium]